MKKIINGKRYDTETAEYIGSTSWGDGPSDFNHWSEELYRKRTGEFFLYGEGGANSKYREEISMNSWSGGEKIIPLTDDEAREWAEEYLDAEEYEKLFTVTEEEDTGKKIQSFSISGDVISKLTRLSRAHGLSRSQIIEDLVRAAKE